MKIPEGYQQIMPYYILPGATQFMDFVKAVFKAKEKGVYYNDDKTIMHGELKIGNSVIMFADSSKQWEPQTGSVYVYVENVDETYKLALENGATSMMEVEDKDYGRTGGFKDPFGNVWWITNQ